MAVASPFKTVVLSLVNIKGGVAKSVSALFIAWGLALLGYRVLLVDMDPQSNSTYSLTGTLNELPDGTLYEVLKEQPTKTVREIIKPTRHPNLFIAPGSLWLSSTEVELISATMREFVLTTALSDVLPYFHFVIIDTPPNLGLLTINAMVASTSLIVPTTLKLFGLVGIRILNRTLEALRFKFKQFHITLPILGVLVTQVRRPMTRNATERYNQLKEMFGETLFATIIPLTEKLEEATDQEASEEATGYEYAPGGIGVLAYTAVVKEILHRVGVTQEPTNG
ncbi:MAG: ParA family protein [Ktedonobacteraceae bacterium]